MTDWILAIEGTPAAAQYALALALVSALAHASFGALQKGRHDPWLSRGAIDLFIFLMATPVALAAGWPGGVGMAAILAGAWAIHLVYKLLQAMAYVRGAYTVVYPVVRGVGPIATVIAASAVFGERFAPWQWFGVALLSGAILALGAWNLRKLDIGRETLVAALLLAVLTGLMVAVYTTWDAYGIRLAEDPFAFLAWFFMLEGVVFPWIALSRWRRMADPPAPGPLLFRGFCGALIAFLSFGSVMLATRLDKVGEAAAVRETSTVFAALIGWAILKERVGPVRALLMCLIALGAVFVEFG